MTYNQVSSNYRVPKYIEHDFMSHQISKLVLRTATSILIKEIAKGGLYQV